MAKLSVGIKNNKHLTKKATLFWSDIKGEAHTINHETQDELFQLSQPARQGAAIASAISIEEALESLPDRTLLPILFDLHQKFEQIQHRLDAI